MDETLFYVFGIGLVVSAIALSAIGLRFENFPPTRAALVAVIVYFAGMVAATTTFAVLNARDAAHTREAKDAEEAAASGTGEPRRHQRERHDDHDEPRHPNHRREAQRRGRCDRLRHEAARGPRGRRWRSPSPTPRAIAHDVCLSRTRR